MIERYRRRESSVEEALMGTCPLGVSTRNVEGVTRTLWDEGLSAGTAPNPDQEASEKVDAWRRRPLASERPYACVDGTYARRSWGGAYEGVAVLVAIGADPDGRREAVGVEEGHGESEDSWRELLLGPGDRGLAGAGPAAGDKSAGTLGALSEVFPSAECQRCTVRSCRNVLAKVPKRRRKAVAAQPEATRAQESLEAPAYARLPPEHWRRIRTNNGIERLNREIKRRTKAVASFPDGRAATMLAAARCKYMAEGSWGTMRYLDVSLLEGWDVRGSAEGQGHKSRNSNRPRLPWG
ncbi:transposase, partial [Atopobiaceae bacterium HCP3S3_D6]